MVFIASQPLRSPCYESRLEPRLACYEMAEPITDCFPSFLYPNHLNPFLPRRRVVQFLNKYINLEVKININFNDMAS